MLLQIATIPETTCWPKQVHYLMVLTSAEKPKWLAALNNVCANSEVKENPKYQGTLLHVSNQSPLNFNCMIQINDKVSSALELQCLEIKKLD